MIENDLIFAQALIFQLLGQLFQLARSSLSSIFVE